MILFQSGNLVVRELGEEDASLLVKWLSDDRVLEYYEGRDRPHDMALVKEHFYERQFEITQCIIVYDDMPIGYIQYYPISEEERVVYEYPDPLLKVFGIDQFIGEVDYWNKGIGTELIRACVHHLIEKVMVDAIVMDPQTWNQRALKVYEKCGFVKKKLLPKYEWHEGEYRDCWLIEYNTSNDII